MKPKIAMVGNNLQMMCNFRLEVMLALKQSGYDIVVIAPHSSAIATLLQHNIRFVPITIQPRSTNPIKDWILLRQLTTIYRQEQFDFVFHYTTKIVLYGSIAARWANTPQIPVMTGLGVVFSHTNIWSKIFLTLYKSAFHHAKEVWFLNPDDQHLFIKNGVIPRHKTFLLPSEGVNTTLFHTNHSLSTQPFTFAYIGRMLKEKGIEDLVQAISILQKRENQFQVYLVGPVMANDSSIPLTQLRTWEQAGLIKYIPATSHIIPYYEQATCIVLPSYREGVSRVLLEAASMARPAITTDVPGCRDVVEHGINGWLCSAKDPNSLALAMLTALDSQPEQLLQMGKRGREKVVQHFDINKIINIYLNKLTNYLNTL